MDGMAKKRVHIGRELVIVALAYTGLTAAVTWPVLAHLSDAVAGFDGRDSFQGVWLLWWFWEALLTKHQLPAQVSMLYFPQGASHPGLWVHPLVCLLGLPLTGLLGPVASYNLALLASFVARGITGYLLARLLSKQARAAFIGGLIFAFAPNQMGHSLAGHIFLVFSAALALYTLALWLWLKRSSWRLSCLYAISLSLALLSFPHFIGYFLLPVTLVLLAASWLRRGLLSRQRWQGLFLCWIIGGLAFLPFAWPTLADLSGDKLAYLRPQDTGEHSADLVSFFIPSPYHPLWEDTSPPFTTLALDRPRALEEGFNYIGLVALVLTGIAVWRRWSQVGPWLVILGLAVLFSLGPVLKIGGHVTQFTMPYALIDRLPFFSWSRTPGRLAVTAMLAVSVLAALGTARIMGWCHGERCRWGLLVAMTGFIVFEYLPMWPFPLDSRPVSPYYHQLAQEQTRGGLLDMPVSGSRRSSNYAMYYQTIHHKPLAGGYIERDPPGTEELRLFTDRLLSPPDFAGEVVLTPPPTQRVAVLHAMKVTEVVAHPALMTDQAARATLAFMPEVLGTPYYTDGDLFAWRVPPVETPLPPYTLLLAEKGWEAAGDGSLVRLKQEGILFIYSDQAGPATLTVARQGQLSEGQELWVGDFGPFAAASVGGAYQIPLYFQAGLSWLEFRLTGCKNCSTEFSRITVE